MSCHSHVAGQLMFYAAGTLSEAERRAVDEHLAICRECREELAFWREVGGAVVAADGALPAPSPAVLAGALARMHARRSNPLARAWALIQSQVPLVRREIWPASALVMAVGYLLAVFMGSSRGDSTTLIEALAPLVAAAGLAAIYGPENDPGLELALATPTSPRQVLLARLALVFGYDLLLALAASVGLLVVIPPGLLGTVILNWLAPMTFLSALALALSMCIGTGNAVTVAFFLWLSRGLAGSIHATGPAGLESAFPGAALAYIQAWQSPVLLFALAGALIILTVGLVSRQERFLAARA